jgi:hypothetical protein
MISARGGEVTQVTQGAVPILGVTISADTKTLVYRQSESISYVFVSAIDGNSIRQLTFDDIRVIVASLSPDGKHLAYVIAADVDKWNPEAHLVIADREGKNRKQLTFGSERILNARWSPDGNLLAYASRGIGEPDDSSGIYVIHAFNPSPPKFLGRGTLFAWVDGEHVVAYAGFKTMEYSVKGIVATHAYQDSTFTVPIHGNKQLILNDFRKGREGVWVFAVNDQGKQTGEGRQLIPANVDFAAPPDMRFFIYGKPEGDELWRVWSATGKEERIGKALAGRSFVQDVSLDGKEILWIKSDNRSKLVLVKNLFE